MKGYKRHDFYIRVKKAGEPSLEKHTGGYITVRDGVTYACERLPVEGKELRWNVWHVLTGLRVNREPLKTSQDVEDFLAKLDHNEIRKAADLMRKRALAHGGDSFDVYMSGGETLGWEKAVNELNTYGSDSDL